MANCQMALAEKKPEMQVDTFAARNNLLQAQTGEEVMESLRDGIEALVESLQRDIASSTSSNNSSQSNTHSSRPNFPPSRCVAFPPPVNAFSSKKDASPAMSDSAKTSGSVSVEVSMHDAVSSPGPSCVTGPAGMPTPANRFCSDGPRNYDTPPRRAVHRRARSEIPFRPQDEILFEPEICLDSGEFLTLSDETGEELLSGYLDMENTNSSDGFGPTAFTNNEKVAAKPPHRSRSFSVEQLISELDSSSRHRPELNESHGPLRTERPRHHHSFSMDGSISFTQEMLMNELDSLDSKKAVDANKLAELALLDPKRAKRILANRQSAARSKERKMRYIAELERKVQTLQTEATSLSNQLAILQRDTTGLSIENNELKLRLQAMEQQAQLRDALNDTLKDEVQRLKSATVHMSNVNGHAFTIGTHHFAQNSYFQMPSQSQLQHDTQMQQTPVSHSNSIPSVQPSDQHRDFIQQGPFG